MVDKLFVVAPRVQSPDYGSYIRQSMGAAGVDSSTFAQTLEQQQVESERQSSASIMPKALPPLEGRFSGMEGTPGVSTAPAKSTSPAVPLDNAGVGIALDQRSLATLQRLAHDADHPVKKVAPRSVTRSGGQSGQELGTLSAKYESGTLGGAAIGYDRNGGTSYGKYQISSRQGSFKQFMGFLADNAPDLAERLTKAGNPNTGSKRGAVPDEWRAIADEQPERFEKLQEAFIRDSHYEPAFEGVRQNLGVTELSRPVQEVLWSTAVQHGPAGAERLFAQAAKRLASQGKELSNEKALIETVYNLRKGQFSSSTPSVQAAVRRRFEDESRQALAMLTEQTALA